MPKNLQRMKMQRNVRRLIEYLRDREPTTVTRIVADGVLDSRGASDAVQYGIRLGVIERIRHPGMKSGERVQYRLTGKPLRAGKPARSAPSFEALLAAWGIGSASPQWPSEHKRVVQVD